MSIVLEAPVKPVAKAAVAAAQHSNLASVGKDPTVNQHANLDEKIRMLHHEINREGGSSLKCAIEAGELLEELHDTAFRNKDEGWEKRVRALGMTPQTANNYRKVAEANGNGDLTEAETLHDAYVLLGIKQPREKKPVDEALKKADRNAIHLEKKDIKGIAREIEASGKSGPLPIVNIKASNKKEVNRRIKLASKYLAKTGGVIVVDMQQKAANFEADDTK